MCQKYPHQKLSESDNWFSGCRRNVGDVFGTQCICT